MTLLKGIRVLDFTRYIAGPLCTMYLAEWGAEVIKIEDPSTGDDTRTWEPIKNNFSGYFAAFNRSKKSMTLDLKHESSKSIIKGLAETCDVVVCNFSPGVTKKLGIDYETLKQFKPDLIYCDISGFGQTGPYRRRKGFDTIFQAMGGMMSLTGTGSGEPVKAGVPIGDYSGAYFSTMSILASLFQRERTGKGEYIDLALFDCVVNLLPLALAFHQFTGKAPEPKGTEHPGRVPSSAFQTKDGGYVQVSVTDAQWFDFCKVVVIPDEIAHHARYMTNKLRVHYRDEIISIIQDYVGRIPQKELVASCLEAGIPCGEVNRLEDIIGDPQLLHRNIFKKVAQEDVEELHYINFPAQFSSNGYQTTGRPPALGEHTCEILSDLLGKSKSEIADLRNNKVI